MPTHTRNQPPSAPTSLSGPGQRATPDARRVADARLQACKSRAYRADDYYVADGGAPHAFAH